MSDFVWIRREGQPEGREMKVYLSPDSHVADVRAQAADVLRFAGQKASVGQLVVKTEAGEELPARMSIKDLNPQEVLVVALEGVDVENDWSRAKSWSGAGGDRDDEGEPGLPPTRGKTWVPPMVSHEDEDDDDDDDDDDIIDFDGGACGGFGEGDEDDLPPRADTWHGFEDEKKKKKKKKSKGLDKLVSTSSAASEGRREEESGDAGKEEEEEGEQEQEEDGLPPRSSNRTWHAGMQSQGIDTGLIETLVKSPSSTMDELSTDPPIPMAVPKPGAHVDTTGDGIIDSVYLDTNGDGVPDCVAPLMVPVHASPLTPGAQLLVDTTGDGRPDSILRDTTGDGCGDMLERLEGGLQAHDLVLPTAPKQSVKPAQISKGPVPAVYVDRIPPDASDDMIRSAINSDLPPCGVEKVQSLEVIRNQKTRHCHAFAFLTSPPPTSIIQVKLEGMEEYIRVQPSDKRREVPRDVTPRSTLHVRLYAKRRGWASNISKMEWAGLLAVLEDVSPQITDCISVVADDKSRKNLQVHKSVLLCAFFVECRNVQTAEFLRQHVHDTRTTKADNVVFLIQCDYTLTDKKLHDTCRKKEVILRQYANALKQARDFSKNKGLGSWPEGAKEFFEFDGRIQEKLEDDDLPAGGPVPSPQHGQKQHAHNLHQHLSTATFSQQSHHQQQQQLQQLQQQSEQHRQILQQQQQRAQLQQLQEAALAHQSWVQHAQAQAALALSNPLFALQGMQTNPALTGLQGLMGSSTGDDDWSPSKRTTQQGASSGAAPFTQGFR